MSLNTHQVGTISELAVMQEYAKRGYTIYEPLQPGRADFLAEKNNRYVRVQVKTGTPYANGKEIAGFSNKPYTKEDIDVIAVYDPNENQIYYIPVEHVEGQKIIRIRLTPYVYNSKKLALDKETYSKFLG